MIVLFAALSTILGSSDNATKSEILPRKATWAEATNEVFLPLWMLPDDLKVAGDEGFGPAWNLIPKMKELTAMVTEPSKLDPSAPRCLGDIVLAVKNAGGDARAREKVLDQVRFAQPKLWEALSPCVSDLVCDVDLNSKKWDPDKNSACDGIFFARPLTLAGCTIAPWSRFGGSRLVQQLAELIYADLESIKNAENDYTTYRERPGASYIAIYPVDGSYLRGDDDRGNPFAALKLYFKCDLPFPYSTYECDLRLLNWTDKTGEFACEVFSPSKDFYWLAGRDVFYPVRTSEGKWVATMIVRLFGFDLSGVPDGDDDRQAGARSSLGSLKRTAEARFLSSGSVVGTQERSAPRFAVRSSRR